MKCLLFQNEIEISKCIQILKWIENSLYCLCIHDKFFNKLISKCGENKDIESLKYVHNLIQRNIIQTKKRIIGNSYGICNCVSDALRWNPN